MTIKYECTFALFFYPTLYSLLQTNKQTKPKTKTEAEAKQIKTNKEINVFITKKKKRVIMIKANLFKLCLQVQLKII